MRCPRCQLASPDDAVFCPACGAPLAFRAEPTPRPLDLSISLDRRAPGREVVFAPSLDGSGSLAWSLAPTITPVPARYAPPAPLPGDELDDLEFGPVPELTPELELLPTPDLARSLPDAPEPAPFDEPLAERETAGERSFSRALGLAPDPVVPDDLGLQREEEPGSAPGALELPPLRRGEPLGAALARDLDLDLALDDGGGPVEERELDAALPASARPAQLPLPLRETGPRLRPARPWRRAAAWAIDVAPLALLWLGALAALYDGVPLSPGDRAGLAERVLRDGGALALPLLAGVATLALVHQTLAHALAGATLGKRLLGLRLVSEDGQRPTVERCATRAALSAASVLLLGLGLLPALFTRSGRALHDISAGTRVVESP